MFVFVNVQTPRSVNSVWFAEHRVNIGLLISCTVTVAMHVSVFPLLSVTVRVTAFGPKSAQVKAVLSATLVAIPQASFDPLSISFPVIDALPDASNWMVISWHIAVGATLSSTVIVVEHVSVFPAISVTVNVTSTGAPMLAQMKVFGETSLVTIEQLSEEPTDILLISVAFNVYEPSASNWIVIGAQTATGSIISWTVTVAVHVDSLLLVSVTVKVTELGPKSEQVKSVLLATTLWIPQLSFDPLLISSAIIEAFPAASNWIVISWQIEFGTWSSFTVTV